MKLDEIKLSQELIKFPSYSGYDEEVLNYLANYIEYYIYHP